jgi:peptidoglycan/xylan/chitin deacetylase (PgdA/CDA1 family)
MTLKERAKSMLGRGIVSTGLHRVFLRGGAVIVAFHRVNDMLRDDPLTVSPRSFESFCKFFRDNFDVIGLDDLVDRMGRGAPIHGAVAITFDDGYLDNFEVAAPILRKLALPATFFVATRFLGSATIPWWDRRLVRQPGWMTWDHVRTLSFEGFDIGAHTRTHADLGTIDGAEADGEIQGSRQDLLDALGRAPAHFAFPYGQRSNLSASNRQRIRGAGFKSCVSCFDGLTDPRMDPFHLPRVTMSPWLRSPEQFVFDMLARAG